MISPLLLSKIYTPPPRTNLVRRAHLIEKLNDGVRQGHKLTLISAPAGFGKTTTLSTWQNQCGFPTAWLSLDAGDNDPTRFLVYFVTALQTIAPDAGQIALALLHTTHTVPVESVLATLVNELASIPHDFSLCLDDYHLIDTEEIHTAVIFLIEHSPEKMHLALASRSDPPFPLSRWRARGQLLELRQEDLRFTGEEVSDFLNQSIGISLTTAQISTLEARTDGWIAGLQLAGLSLQGKEDIATFIQEFSGSHRFVIDYLADEVVSQLPDDLQRFMQNISILDRFTAPLCDVINEHTVSASLLKILEDANLFLIPLDDQREWYRYHHLFRDYLNTELDNGRLRDLHKKAANWFVSNNLYQEAVNHALASGDTELAVHVISKAAAAAFSQAAFRPLLGWLDALPEEQVRGNTLLATYKGLALFLTGPYQDALPYVEAAEKSLSPDTPASIHGRFLSLKAHIALCEEQLDHCVQYSRDALEYIDDENHFTRSLTLNILGQVLEMKGDIASAAEIYHQAFKAGWQAGDQIGALIVFTNLIFALNELGRRREAVTLCNQLAASGEAQTSHGFSLLDANYLSWSLLSYEANELDKAYEQAQRALDFLSAANFSLGILWGLFILASVHLAKGDFEAMAEITQKGVQLASQLGREPLQGAWFKSLEAQADINQGVLSRAASWAESAGYSPQDSPHHWAEIVYFTYVRVLLTEGRFEAAIALLSTMAGSAREGRRLRKLITVTLQQSLCHQAMDQKQEALSLLEEAIEIAAPQDYRRAFLNEGAALVDLLQNVRARSESTVAAEFIDQILEAFDIQPVRPAEQALAEPLSERELQVLRLLVAGFSSTEVAEELYIAVGTARTHIKNIYRKLDVHSRSEAFRQAHELGLLKTTPPYE